MKVDCIHTHRQILIQIKKKKMKANSPMQTCLPFQFSREQSIYMMRIISSRPPRIICIC